MKPTSKNLKKQGKGKFKGKQSKDGNFKAKNRKENAKAGKGNFSGRKKTSKGANVHRKPAKPQSMSQKKVVDSKKDSLAEKSQKPDEATSKGDAKKSKGYEKKDELVGRMMNIYETLRRCDVAKEEKAKLIDEVLKLSNGKQSQIAFKHNSVRVLEMCVKYGNKEQRGKIWIVFSDLFEDIMKSKYGRFLIQKMLKYGTKEQRGSLVTSVKGKVLRLLKHKDAGRTLEDLYAQYANPAQKRSMVEEFYGPEYPILKASFGSDLKGIFTSAPDRKRFVLSFLKDAVEKLASKEVVTYSLYHRAAAEYLIHAEKVARVEFLQNLKEKVVNILHTEDGAKISMQCIWSGNAKERKSITKSFKTYVTKICKEPHGHAVLMSLFDVIDDTLLVEKTILTELLSNLDELITDQYGRRVILYVLAPRNTKYFSPPLVQLLSEGDDNENSKKPNEVRRAELQRSVVPALVTYFEPRIEEAMRDNHLCQILIEVVKNITDAAHRNTLVEKIAEVVCQKFEPSENEQNHVISNPIGHWALTRLLLQDKEGKEQGYSPLLCQTITHHLTPGALRDWIRVSRGAFIVARMVEIGVPEVITYIREDLAPCIDTVDFWSSKGLEALRKALNEAN